MNNALPKKLWLVFAQSVTVCLGLAFVLQLLAPSLLEKLSSKTNSQIVLKQAAPSLKSDVAGSYSQAVKKPRPLS